VSAQRKMFSHDRVTSGKEEWLTPPYILKALGEFDLDPCAPIVRPWPTAAKHYTIEDNGLVQPWFGRVWLNPPYGKKAGQWMRRLVDHGNGIALIFARTETSTFFDAVWGYADACLFMEGRIAFHHVNGQRGDMAGAPSMLIAYGEQNIKALRESGLPGHFQILTKRRPYERIR